MLRNVAKYRRFRQVFDVVCRDKTVLDIGTGSCVLALLAVKAGARRVIAVERPEVAEHSEAVLHRLNIGRPKIELIVGDFLQIDPAVGDVDLAVCETVGYLGLEEDILRLLRRARSHWLKPAGLVVPRSIGVRLIPGSRQLSESATQAFLSSETTPFGRMEPEFHGLPIRLGNPHDEAAPVAFESRWKVTSPQRFDSVTVDVYAQLWGDVEISNSEVRNWPRCVIPLGLSVTARRHTDARFKLSLEQQGTSFEATLQAELECERSGPISIQRRFLTEDVVTNWPTGSGAASLVDDVLDLIRRC